MKNTPSPSNDFSPRRGNKRTTNKEATITMMSASIQPTHFDRRRLQNKSTFNQQLNKVFCDIRAFNHLKMLTIILLSHYVCGEYFSIAFGRNSPSCSL